MLFCKTNLWNMLCGVEKIGCPRARYWCTHLFEASLDINIEKLKCSLMQEKNRQCLKGEIVGKKLIFGFLARKNPSISCGKIFEKQTEERERKKRRAKEGETRV